MAYSAVAFHDLLRASPGLTDPAFRMAVVLSGYANKKGQCWPSQRRLAADLGWSLRKAQYALRELQAVGFVSYLKRARHRGEKSLIQLLSGAKPCTGANPFTGARSCKEPAQDPAKNRRKGLRSELPPEPPHEQPQGADAPVVGWEV